MPMLIFFLGQGREKHLNSMQCCRFFLVLVAMFFSNALGCSGAIASPGAFTRILLRNVLV